MRSRVKQRTQIYKTATKTRAWSLKAIGGGGGEAGERSGGLFRDIFRAEGNERWLYLEKGGGGWRWREEYALGWRRCGRVLDGGGVDSYVTASVRTLIPLWCRHTHTHTFTQRKLNRAFLLTRPYRLLLLFFFFFFFSFVTKRVSAHCQVFHWGFSGIPAYM